MTTTDHSPAIQVVGVHKRFGQVHAVQDVSFSVAPGELFFLLGPSGCGKTTLLRLLAGLELPDAGRVLFNGHDVTDQPPYRRDAPMVFQNYALWPHLTVRENVAFGLVERRVGRAEIATRTTRALERVSLAGLGERTPGQLSGGQQQRVVLARALVLNPDLVFLDEPLSNLDAKLRGEMREEIEALHHDTDITFVYVTHDQAEALSLADRMAVMRGGRLDSLGAPRDLYHRPPTLFCADFLGEANMIPVTVGPGEISAGAAAWVSTPWGDWQAVAVGTVPSGTRATCVVRPESLGPADAATDRNRLTAEIVGVRMNGSTVTVTLSAEGVALKACLPNRYDLDLPLGSRREWAVDPRNAVVVPE